MKTNNRKTVYRVRNWSQYNKALMNRGSLTIWIDEAVLKSWQRPRPSGQPGRPFVFANELILLLGSLREVYHLPLRQSIGFAASILRLMQLEIALPNYSTLDRRLRLLDIPLKPRPSLTTEPLVLLVDSTGVKVSGEGEWKVRLHGKTKNRTWRKLHLAQDWASWEVVAVSMSDAPSMDHQQLPKLLKDLPPTARLSELIGDVGYDYKSVHAAVLETGGRTLVPPRTRAKAHPEDSAWRDRDKAIKLIAVQGKAAWKSQSGYHRRSRAETTMFRFKQLFGDQLRTKTDTSQLSQLKLRSRILNIFTELGMPKSYALSLPT